MRDSVCWTVSRLLFLAVPLTAKFYLIETEGTVSRSRSWLFPWQQSSIWLRLKVAVYTPCSCLFSSHPSFIWLRLKVAVFFSCSCLFYSQPSSIWLRLKVTISPLDHGCSLHNQVLSDWDWRNNLSPWSWVFSSQSSSIWLRLKVTISLLAPACYLHSQVLSDWDWR